MKKAIFLIIVAFLSNQSFAQKTNKIGLGIQYTSLDLPDDRIFIPNINYQKMINRRFFVSLVVGYAQINGFDKFFKTIPEKRSRFTTDIIAQVAVLRFKENYLKIGGGTSIWYRNDNIVDTFKFDLSDQTRILDYKYKSNTGWNVGYNLMSELEISCSKQVSLSSNFGVANLGNAGISTILGVKSYYKF